MRVLVHLCCGPCGITVLQGLAEIGHDLAGLFFNPNIHALAEYMRRREGAAQTAQKLGVRMLFADTLTERQQQWHDPWLDDAGDRPGDPEVPCFALQKPVPRSPAMDPAPWLRAVAGREEGRCLFCWRMRLRKTAELARELGYEAFSSSLLYSRYQNHEVIRKLGDSIAADLGIAFVYADFRPFWQEGIRISKEWGIYRQQYCGCIYSEYDRYARDFRRLCNADARTEPSYTQPGTGGGSG